MFVFIVMGLMFDMFVCLTCCFDFVWFYFKWYWVLLTCFIRIILILGLLWFVVLTDLILGVRRCFGWFILLTIDL